VLTSREGLREHERPLQHLKNFILLPSTSLDCFLPSLERQSHPLGRAGDRPSQYSIVSNFQHSQARIKAAELDRTATERRAATAEREVVALRRQLEEAAADTEEAVQGALAEAHEAFDAEVGRLPVPPRGACRLLRASVSSPLILVWHDRTALKLNYAEKVVCSVYHCSS
jgi:hypothetical protein